jgi:hypothetical protein
MAHVRKNLLGTTGPEFTIPILPFPPASINFGQNKIQYLSRKIKNSNYQQHSTHNAQ